MTTSERPPALSARRLREIADLAEGIAGLYATGGRIEPTSILRANGIKVSFGRYEDAFDGLLEHRQGRFHVYCNLNRVEHRDSPRARFTLAHEAGHYYIDAHRHALAEGHAPAHGSRTDFATNLPAEREADTFASYLLMPDALFTQALRRAKGVYGLGAVLRVADDLGTSVTATAIRLATSGLTPCCVVRWGPEGAVWVCPSRHFAEAGRRSVKRGYRPPPDSATGKARADVAAPPTGYFDGASTARTWFQRVGASVEHDVILKEEAMRLGRFGTLTLLTLFDP